MSKKKPGYKCPKCASPMAFDEKFDEGVAAWICPECGEYLMDSNNVHRHAATVTMFTPARGFKLMSGLLRGSGLSADDVLHGLLCVTADWMAAQDLSTEYVLMEKLQKLAVMARQKNDKSLG